MSIRILPAIVAIWLFAVGRIHGQTPVALTSCDFEGFTFCEAFRPTPRVWGNAESLLWWIRKGPIPTPLVTTGNPADPFAGALGRDGTNVLVGEQNIGYGAFSGARVQSGFWFDMEQLWGLELNAFLLPSRPLSRTLTSNAAGNPPIFIPLKDVLAGEDSFTVAFPQGVSGTVTVSSSSRLWGTEASFLRGRCQEDRGQFTVLAGIRYLNLDENLQLSRIVNDFGGILADPSNPGNPQPKGTILATSDRFRASNHFVGGQIAARGQFNFEERWSVDVTGKLALGSTLQALDIAGSTTQQKQGATPTAWPSGLFAGANNSGYFEHSRFSFVPEVDIKIGYQLTKSLSLYTGYTFLFWTNVIRPGNQISRTVDERTIPTAVVFTPGFQAALPAAPTFNQSSFWAQGIVFGLQYRY